ncbi:MAG: HD domain-containing protein [Deltaproteobacteria bacterium]|nr:HD domain-containing protein [Deltaproteobacteria bacterium]
MSQNIPRFLPETPLPSLEEVADLWDRYDMMPHIRDHSLMVARVALTLHDWLAEAGLNLWRPAVEVGALLHDIAKTPCIRTGCRHQEVGAEILAAEGYPELAYLVGAHVHLPPEQPLDETMLVNYADKRVNHDQVVALEERYAYIMERYAVGDPDKAERIAHGRERAFEAERRIFQRIGGGRSPLDLASAVGKAA